MRRRQYILSLAAIFATAASSAVFLAASRRSADGDVSRLACGVFSEPMTRSEATSPGSQSLESLCLEKGDRLCRRLGRDCRVVVHCPFILGGDYDETALDLWYTGTIEPAWRAMARCYFEEAPSRPITLLLFSNESTYRRHADRLFFDSDVSRFGYYKPSRRTALVNLAWGDGPLLHELTHALMATDFPGASTWLSEGLASLHEASRIRQREDGPNLEGQVNWRLELLRTGTTNRRLPSLERLVGSSSLCGEAEALNYAQARYFCMFLQRRRLLTAFYHRYRADHREDPQGRRTVLSMFPECDWDDLDIEFRQWMASLPNP